MRWFYLFVAGALEITWAITMKMSDGFTILMPSIITGIGSIASAVFLSIALRQLPHGTVSQVICVMLIVVGIAGLSMIREIVFGVGFALILPLFFGLYGVLYSMSVSDLLTFIVAVILIIQTNRELGSNREKETEKHITSYTQILNGRCEKC